MTQPSYTPWLTLHLVSVGFTVVYPLTSSHGDSPCLLDVGLVEKFLVALNLFGTAVFSAPWKFDSNAANKKHRRGPRDV